MRNIYLQFRVDGSCGPLAYVKLVKLMPNFIDDLTARVFLNFKDEQLTEMTSSSINKRIQKLWRGGPSTKKITATRMRKAISTAVSISFTNLTYLCKYLNNVCVSPNETGALAAVLCSAICKYI
jgi:hypothetical protein